VVGGPYRRADAAPLARVLRLPAHPRFLILAGILFVVLCTVLAAWSVRSRPDVADFDLRNGKTSSNLDTSNNVPLATSRAPDTPVNAKPQADIPEPKKLPPATDRHEPAGIIEIPELPPLPPVEEKKFNQESHRGDDPMSRFKKIGSALVLAVALSAQPLASAADDKPTDPKAAEISDKLDKLNKSLEKFNDLPERLNRIEKSLNSLEMLRGEVNSLRNEVTMTGKILDLVVQSNAKTQEEVKTLHKQYEDLVARFQQLEAQQRKTQDDVIRISATSDGTNERLRDLQKQVANGTRVSAGPPLPPEGTTGTVRFWNTLSHPISVVLNGRVLRDVLPGETRIADPVAVGNFTYEVLGVHAPITSSLRAGEIVTVRVFPIP
jgi:chaperonin cofactor prefoldin